MKKSKNSSKTKRRNNNRQNRAWWGYVVALLFVIFIIVWITRTVESDDSSFGNYPLREAAPQSVEQQQPAQDKIYTDIGLPEIDCREFFFTNSSGRYSFRYDTAWRQARWVAHTLTAAEVAVKGTDRSDRFRSDPQIINRGFPAAADSDYKKSGYDRGHLLPSADRDDSAAENEATFLLSNVSPQRPALNRGVWKNLEEFVRQVAARYDSVWVVTGGQGDLSDRIGKNRVVVPDYYYKTLLIKVKGVYYAVAFYIPNQDKLQKNYSSYAMSVDQLEQTLGMDFYKGLNDSVEHNAESSVNEKIWFNKR